VWKTFLAWEENIDLPIFFSFKLNSLTLMSGVTFAITNHQRASNYISIKQHRKKYIIATPNMVVSLGIHDVVKIYHLWISDKQWLACHLLYFFIIGNLYFFCIKIMLSCYHRDKVLSWRGIKLSLRDINIYMVSVDKTCMKMLTHLESV
jgi:hypothetical protein